MQKRVLGKGLEALIPKKATQVVSSEFAYLSVDIIKPGKYQPRMEIEKKELDGLAQSIKAKGFIQPIVVRKVGEGYEVVAGGRRFEASKLLGLKEIPTIIKDIDDKDTFLFAIAENLQRKDLNPIEEAMALKRLMDEFEFNLEDMAQLLGKDKTTIVNTLRLLKLPPEIQAAVKKGIVSRTQARSILAIDNKDSQRRLFQQILKEGLSVREIELMAKRVSKRKRPVDPFVVGIEEKLQKILGTKVKVFNRKKNKGKIVVEYYSLEDLERIMGRLE